MYHKKINKSQPDKCGIFNFKYSVKADTNETGVQNVKIFKV